MIFNLVGCAFNDASGPTHKLSVEESVEMDDV